MDKPRELMIHSLMEVAVNAMLPLAADATGDEIISACLNLAYRAVASATNRDACRASVERIYALLPPMAPKDIQ